MRKWDTFVLFRLCEVCFIFHFLSNFGPSTGILRFTKCDLICYRRNMSNHVVATKNINSSIKRYFKYH